MRNAYLPQRELQTGIGSLELQVRRARDRDPQGPGVPIQGPGRFAFRSRTLPSTSFYRRGESGARMWEYQTSLHRSIRVVTSLG